MEGVEKSVEESRLAAAEWIWKERLGYADLKYNADRMYDNDVEMHTYGLTEEGMWWTFLTNYLKRAQVLGVDTLAGRQAFGKFLVTCMSAFESMIRTEGEPPYPGVSSGVIQTWR